MGVRALLWSRGIAAMLALPSLPTAGCSWIFVNKPPREPTHATPPVECTSSVASPVIDTGAAGLLVGAGVAAIVASSHEKANWIIDTKGMYMAGGILSFAAAVPLAFSAGYGYSTTSECRQWKERHLACLGGEPSCGSVDVRKPWGALPAVAMACAPHDCPGSWLPVHNRKPGNVVVCDFCGLNVAVVAAPLDWAHDPWRGSTLPRVVQQPESEARFPLDWRAAS
jgi:hypothetical protein